MFDLLKRFFKHSTVYALGNIINRAGAFLLLPLYTNYLTTGEYGTLEIFTATSTVIRVFLSMGIAHATLRFYFEYDKKKDRKEVVSTSFLISFIVSSTVILILCYFSPLISKLLFKNNNYTKYFIIVFLILHFELSQEICFSFLRAREYSKFYIFVTTCQLLLQVSINYYAVAKLQMGIFGVLVGNFISVFIAWIILATTTLRHCGFSINLTKFKNLFLYSYPFLLSSISIMIIGTSDRFLLKAYSTLSILGLYALAMRFGLIIRIILVDPFSTSFGPFRFSIMKDDNANQIYSRILTYFALIVAMLCLAISFFSKMLLVILSKETFWDAHKVIPIIVLAVGLTGVTYIFQTGILITKKTKYMFYLNTISSIVILSLNWLLIPYFNMYGAAIALLITNIVMCLTTYYISQKLLFIKYDLKRMVTVFAVGIGLYMLALLCPSKGFVVPIIIKLTLLTAFPLVLGVIGFYKEDELKKFWYYKNILQNKAKYLLKTMP